MSRKVGPLQNEMRKRPGNDKKDNGKAGHCVKETARLLSGTAAKVATEAVVYVLSMKYCESTDIAAM